MNKTIIYDITQSEMLIMELLWKDGAKSFAEIKEFLCKKEGKEWKKQTISTFIKRLSDKGLVEADETGKCRVYHATMTSREYERGRAKKFLGDFYGGSLKLFLSALADGGMNKELADELKTIAKKEFTSSEED